MKTQMFLISFLLHLFLLCTAATEHQSPITSGSIVFATYGRTNYAWDIFTLPTSGPPNPSNELRVTDGQSVNFNGHFPSTSSSSILSLLLNRSLIQNPKAPGPALQLIYVTERDGVPNVYYDALYYSAPQSIRLRSALEVPVRVQAPLLGLEESKNRVSMKDRPSLSGENLIYVSTHEDPSEPRTSWAAVYSTNLRTGLTRRLTPYGVADFSPAVSPSGVWTAVASYGRDGWVGEVEELSTDIYVFLTRDGTNRVKVVEHGGWPCWVDDSTLYFHKKSEDQWVSVYKATFPNDKLISTNSVTIQRVTPPGLHAFTPATSPGNHKFIAVATRRPNSIFRHIELLDTVKNEFIELTRHVSPTTHHLNPFISPDSALVGYHKCRGENNGGRTLLLLENVKSPVPNLSIFRAGGSFPTFSPAGDRIAYADFPGINIANRDGSNMRKVFSWTAFATAWDPVRKGIVYTSAGPTFSSESTEVDIIAINVDSVEQPNYKKLTIDGKNNAFPSPSPDGKQIVFRSGRSGHKNLYIMDAIEGEKSGLQRLTDGPWTDTMCNWSPDGDLIAFASDRHNPGSGSFEIYLIHPNGTGLRKLISSTSSGRTNHPWFSPDGKLIVFTTDYGGISAEPISNPHQYQPYGEIYVIKPDGSGLQRLTHNSYEDGTPSWAPFYINPDDVESPKRVQCAFEDCHFLNKMPGRGTTRVEPSGLAQPRCGA
ncbi:hypothetical protein F3Y22_tig00110198pilonHSYRG00196 [Hibiscus syriacus]|uniref:Thylakoidal processing peptidase 1 n=1 Tax=Hibiscus syriacus TaxID=106335 RepID=A0A6A3BEH1_HIBSY|nr:uncharacterized protein LOC120218573 [Hibiscus syriacus]KAE8714335.1 hypothetical protein F3Y22_tig00110198pilonHSYRG00196 [Hibiscus syriacus]